MDGKALLDSLADWTAESHPNVSLEARQHNNELMADFRAELFNLLGTTTQVGGADGISIVQPMDETLIRELSPAELEYRLDLAEFGVQTGGKVNLRRESKPEKELGWLKQYKIWQGIRTFNDFVDDFEKLRVKINTNMAGYEVEAQRTKEVADDLIKTIRRRFLNAKLKTLWGIIKANESELAKPEGKIKRDVLEERIKRADNEELRLRIETKKYRKLVKKAFDVRKSWYKLNIKFDLKKGFIKTKKQPTIVDKLEADVKKQVEAYAKLNTEMNYYTKQITEAKNLKALEAAVASKPVNELTKAQRRELARYQKNREKYEKMYGFNETKREEYEKLVNKKENLLITLEFLRTTLYAEQYMAKETAMTSALTEWETSMTSVYQDLSTCITNSGTYKVDLNNLNELIAENANNVSKLLSGMPEFESIKVEYEKYSEQCEKAYEYQESIHNTLGEIKNKFIELIPDKALLPDMFRVTRAQGFVLSIVNEILSKKQLELGGSYDTGKRYFERKIRELKGGFKDKSNIPLIENQTGGFYKQIDKVDVHAAIIPHGGTFYEHNNDSQVYDCQTGTYLPAANPLTPVKILSLPFGVRRINKTYINEINKAINHINADKTIYLPLLDVDKECIYVLTAKILDVTGYIRITGKIAKINKAEDADSMNYHKINGNYYFFNIFSEDINKASGVGTRLYVKHEFFRIGARNMLLLPMFYKINPVDNDLFKYDEYVLLHPLNGSVMSAFLNETDLLRYPRGTPIVPVPNKNTFEERYPAPGTVFDYDFINQAKLPTNLGDLPKLPLHLKMEINADLDYNNIEKKYDYYYNFCGRNITIKAQPATGSAGFTTNNSHSLLQYPAPVAPAPAIPNPTDGHLQPPNEINLSNWKRVAALYSQYIAQLTGHLHELIRRVEDIIINDGSPATVSAHFVDVSSSYKTPFPEYYLEYNLAHSTAPAEPINNQGTNPHNYVTQLEKIGKDKTWSLDYQKNMLGIDYDNDTSLIIHLIPIKVLLTDIIGWIEKGKIPMEITDPTAYKTMIVAAAKEAGISPEIILTGPGGAPGTGLGGAPGTGPPAGPTKPNPYTDPKVIARWQFLERAIPAGSAYWENLGKMSTILSKFKSNDYINYNEKLFKIFDTMQLIKKVEDKILNISVDKDGFKVPDFTLIAANLEVKPDSGSKDAFTNAGKKLHDKLKDDKDFITKNRATLPSSDYVGALVNVIVKIARLNLTSGDFWTNLNAITEFNYSPANQYQSILESDDGAKEFVRQLKNTNFLSINDVPKICLGITHLLGITNSRFPDAYKHYQPEITQAEQDLARKKGHGRGHGHKRRGGGRGGH